MDYFETLFKNLDNYCHNGTVAMMVLSQDCEIDNIKSIALKNNQAMQLVSTSKSLFEKNYIFEIKANKSGTSFAR